jgi:hypothetical protein
LLAAARFRGPSYYEVLAWLHAELTPASYVEIGVYRGDSLALAQPPTVALGIDPEPLCNRSWAAPTRIAASTSYDFFATQRLDQVLGADQVSFAFIDGAHRFEQVVDDILHLERYAAPGCVIALHDTMPLHRSATRLRRTAEFHTGDVWKVVPFLREQRPELDLITVETRPSGLTLIRRLDPLWKRPAEFPAALERFAALGWNHYKRRHREFLRLVPSDRAAIVEWLQRASA